jgi:hypothetical protein
VASVGSTIPPGRHYPVNPTELSVEGVHLALKRGHVIQGRALVLLARALAPDDLAAQMRWVVKLAGLPD